MSGAESFTSTRFAPVDKTIDAIRRALESDDRIATAILFGSVAQGVARRDSDIDIGLLARDDAAAGRLRAGQLEFAAELAVIAGRDVQIVLLDEVEPVLGRQVFLHGEKLFERDPRRTACCLERILVAYFDGSYHRRMMEEALDARSAARG